MGGFVTCRSCGSVGMVMGDGGEEGGAGDGVGVGYERHARVCKEVSRAEEV